MTFFLLPSLSLTRCSFLLLGVQNPSCHPSSPSYVYPLALSPSITSSEKPSLSWISTWDDLFIGDSMSHFCFLHSTLEEQGLSAFVLSYTLHT